MTKLTPRLECIAEEIKRCGAKRIADIGTDHALLPIYMREMGIIDSAVACDIAAGPLENAKKNVIMSGVSGIELVLTDGLESLTKSSYDAVVIAGVGGEVIMDIIRKAGEKAHCPLFLQPMTMQEKLRAYLWENGFEIIRETFTSERKKAYCLLSVLFDGKKRTYEHYECYMGKAPLTDKKAKPYLEKLLYQAQKRYEGAVHEGENDQASREKLLIEKLRTSLALL